MNQVFGTQSSICSLAASLQQNILQSHILCEVIYSRIDEHTTGLLGLALNAQIYPDVSTRQASTSLTNAISKRHVMLSLKRSWNDNEQGTRMPYMYKNRTRLQYAAPCDGQTRRDSQHETSRCTKLRYHCNLRTILQSYDTSALRS